MKQRYRYGKLQDTRVLLKRLRVMPITLLLLIMLAGCSAAEEGSEVADSGSEDTKKELTLPEELDALVANLAFEDTARELPDLSQDEAAANFPAELVQQLHEALVAGNSDDLLKKLDDTSLRIHREDFNYEPREGADLSLQEKEINSVLSEQGKTASYDFYRLDMDQDGLDEIIMVERTQYEYSGSSATVILEQNDAGSYVFAGYDYAGYYRLYAIFSYEGTYYMVCNYDDYKRKTTKALGLFGLSGEARGFMWQIHQEHIYLRRGSTDCEIKNLWTSEQADELTETEKLQSAMDMYIQEIGLDLMLRNRNSESFSGAEKALSKEELDKLTAAPDEASWTPAHLGYAPQEQSWLFTLEGQQMYFVLYYKEQLEQYLLEAFLYDGDEEKTALEPIALYGIKPRIHVVLDDYWKHEDSNVETICYCPEDTSLAFPENRREVTAKLWQQVQEESLLADTTKINETEAQVIGDIVPKELVLLAKKALFTRDWSSFDELAAPLELTDHEKVYNTWFATATDYSWWDLDDYKRYIRHIYQYNIGETQFLLLVLDSGGSARFVEIECYRIEENGAKFIDAYTTLDMDARVVSYDGGFYVVDTCYNYNSKYDDTIYLIPLTSEGSSEQAIEVTLLPVDYIWTKGYQSNASSLKQINSYVESIQEELMAASPVNNANDLTVFTGCEESVTDPVKLQRLSDRHDWVMVDYDNDGRLEYQSRHYWFPSNYTTLYLITEEYRLEDITLNLQETWEPECPYRYPHNEYTLIQRWYQEFDGQIYTFQLFLTEGYNYYMNVSLREKEQISWIASYYITPRCELPVQTIGQETTGMG